MLYLYNFGWDISEPLAITCQLKFLLILDRGASTVTTFDLGWKKDSVLCKLRTNQLCMTAQPWEIAASISMGFSHYSVVQQSTVDSFVVKKFRTARQAITLL